MAHRRELDEAAAPQGLVAERLGIEAGRQLAVVAQPHADALGHGHARAPEDAAQQRAQVGLVPAVVVPGRLVLVAPVAVACRRRGRELGQERRDARLLQEVLGLLGVEVVEPVAVDRDAASSASARAERGAVVGELGRRVGCWSRRRPPALPGLPRSSRKRTRSRRSAGVIAAARPIGHQRADLPGRLDLGLRDRTFSLVAGSRRSISLSVSACL